MKRQARTVLRGWLLAILLVLLLRPRGLLGERAY